MILEIQTPVGAQKLTENISERYFSSLNQLEDIFEIVIPYDAKWAFQLGNECKLYNDDGSTLILTGYITGLEIDLSGVILISGASKTWLLSQSVMPPGENLAFGPKLTLKKAIEKICDYVDVVLNIPDNSAVNTALSGLNVNYVILERNQTLLESILELINPYGLFLTTTTVGELVIYVEPFIQEQSGPKSIAAEYIINARMTCVEGIRAEKYETMVQQTMRGLGVLTSNINGSSVLTGHSPLPITKRAWGDSYYLADLSQYRNGQLANYSDGQTMQIFIQTPRHFEIFPRELVKIEVPMFKLSGYQLIVESAEFIIDQKQSYSRYVLSTWNSRSSFSGKQYELGFEKSTKSEWISYS